MKMNTSKFYSSLFVLVLLLQLYLPSFELNLLIQLTILLSYFILEKITFSITFFKQLLLLTGILLMGCLGTLLYKYEPYNIVKDIAHFLKPIIGLLTGYFFYRRINDLRLFIKTVVIAGVISAIIHFIIIGLFVDFGSGRIESIRKFTRDNFLELFALFFIACNARFQKDKLFKSTITLYAVVAILTFSSILYFSRTMIVVAIIMGLTMFGYTKATTRTIKIAGALILAIGLLYSYLYSSNIRRGRPGVEGFLYKVKMAPEEILKTKVNRENHKKLWDHWRGYEAGRAVALMNKNPSSYVFGTGHGSLVDLKFLAPLTGDKKGMRYISELHNGYIYILYKTGIIGIILYLLLLGKWYKKIYGELSFANVAISATGIIFLITTLTITGIYNTRDIIIFILGGLLYFAERSNPDDSLLPAQET